MCSKKTPFLSSERELIVSLVRERPIIEDKRTSARNIELKKQAWEDLTIAYNSHQHVTQRNSNQLKRCWENIKTLRKKELRQEAASLGRTSGGGPSAKDFNTPTSNQNLTLARIRRTKTNTQHDQALFQLRMEREKILIQREQNNLEYEKTIHKLQIEKLELEISILKKKQ